MAIGSLKNRFNQLNETNSVDVRVLDAEIQVVDSEIQVMDEAVDERIMKCSLNSVHYTAKFIRKFVKNGFNQLNETNSVDVRVLDAEIQVVDSEIQVMDEAVDDPNAE
ncbi:hypothetical protein Tco_0345794 [Tanacetum coccineum]